MSIVAKRLDGHPAWKGRGPILVSVLHKYVAYLLTYLDTYPFLTWGGKWY